MARARGGGLSMELHGAAELEAALRELPYRVAKTVLRRSLLQAAVPMAEAGQAMAPTRDLKARMIVSSQLSKRQRAQAGRSRRATSGTYTVTIHVGERPSRVAHLFEFGSAPRYTTGKGDARRKSGAAVTSMKAGAYRGRMIAQPYMRPAFDSTAPEVIRGFGVILGRNIERAATRLYKRQAKRASSAARGSV